MRELYGVNDPPPLPQALEAERAILGAIFLDNSAFYQTERLTVDDFYLAAHRVIFRAMNDLINNGRPIDFVTITEAIEEKALASIGGVTYYTSLTDGLPRVKNIEQYVSIVIEKSKQRKFICSLQAALAEAYENQPIDELISKTDKNILDIEANTRQGPVRISEILPLVNKEAEDQWKIKDTDSAIGYRTGLIALDEFTTGYRKREVAIISGYTSDGKSVLAKQSILAQMADRVPTLAISREISKEQLADDLKTYVAEVAASHSRDKRKMDIFERENYYKIDSCIKHWPLWIDDDRSLHIDDLFHRARKLIRIEGVKIVFIDYMQLITGAGSNATEKMENVCKGIWDLADKESVAVVALSQMSRDEKKQKRRPRLQDLKGASRIEQDGHLVIFVYRPETDSGKATNNDLLIVAKQRHGPKGDIWVEFNEERLIFEKRDVIYV